MLFSKNPHKRYSALIFTLAVAVGVLAPRVSWGQTPVQQWKVKSVRVGFPDALGTGQFKPGLWTPVYVTLQRVEKGRLLFPVQQDGFARGTMTLGVGDADGIEGQYVMPFDLGREDEETVITYANPSGDLPEFQLSVDTTRNKYQVSVDPPAAIDLGEHLYLTLGNRSAGLRQAMIDISPNRKNRDPRPRSTAYVVEPKLLPTQWFGYQPADVVFLFTSDKNFVQDLSRDEERVAALAKWVRQGGRLIVSVSWRNPQLVGALLESPGWQPALPAVLQKEKNVTLHSLVSVNNYANVFGRKDRFPVSPKEPMQIAKLQSDPTLEVLKTEKVAQGEEIILMRMPYGRGSITFVAVELDRPPFTTWNKEEKFWEALVKRLGPKLSSNANENQQVNRFGRQSGSADITTELHRHLDNFNIPQISFGWIALFIFLFILIVGPVDYLILRVVFKRLEWTWITFPTVVIIITLVSYFTAYALKGRDLKINKVELVDIDLRTALDGEHKTKRAYGYGTSWFTILSPRIQDYTVGVEPALSKWSKNPQQKTKTEDVMVTWLGRPEISGAGGFGRQNTTSLFRRSYQYAPGAAGIEHVPIPVWTTKAFSAAWSVKFGDMPLVADLTYDSAKNNEQNLTGTLKSNLPTNLLDCYLFYGQSYYHLKGGLPGADDGGREIKIELNGNILVGLNQGQGIDQWMRTGQFQQQEFKEERHWEEPGRGFFPGDIIRRFYFFDHIRGQNARVNHQYRNLDQSWRIREQKRNDDLVRTAILVGRFARVKGDAERLTNSNDPRMLTHLWLGSLPDADSKKRRPELPGTLVQESYVRVFIPVRPKR